jgi:hypothetical protein
MKTYDISRFFVKLYDWYTGKGGLSSAEEILHPEHPFLFDFLFANALIDASGTPMENISYQHIVDCILFLIAVRQGRLSHLRSLVIPSRRQ